MARKYGIISFGGTCGMVCNSFSTNKSVEQAEARNENGKVTDVWAYSTTVSGSASGVLDDASQPPTVGETFTINGGTVSYLVTGVSKTESNTGAAEISIDFERKDDATIHPYSEVHSSSSSGN